LDALYPDSDYVNQIGLETDDTQFARATCGTIRLKLLKIGAGRAPRATREEVVRLCQVTLRRAATVANGPGNPGR